MLRRLSPELRCRRRLSMELGQCYTQQHSTQLLDEIRVQIPSNTEGMYHTRRITHSSKSAINIFCATHHSILQPHPRDSASSLPTTCNHFSQSLQPITNAPLVMSSASKDSTNAALQVCFGVIGIVGVVITLAGLHYTDSLGCILCKRMRRKNKASGETYRAS
jgi:hypothetical protein